MPESSAKKAATPPPRKAYRPNLWFILASVAICVAVALLIAARDLFVGSAKPTAAAPTAIASTLVSRTTASRRPRSRHPSLKSRRSSTTTAQPCGNRRPPASRSSSRICPPVRKSLSHSALPQCCNIRKVKRVIAALGPLGSAAVEHVERVAGRPLSQIDRLVVGCQPSSSGWLTTLVVHSAEPISDESLLAQLPNAAAKEHAGQKYLTADSLAYFQPKGDGNLLVISPEDSMPDIIDLAGQMPPLRRDIERLVDHTDADRHVTAIFAPNALFSEGQRMFSGELSRLRDPLFWFLGDELSGACR